MLTRSSTRQLRRFYSSRKTEDVVGAFTQRLQDLESQYPKEDVLDFASLIDKDPRLSKLSKELEQRKFDYNNQVAIQATKVPRYADRATRETAHSAPWTGTEMIQDANLRMLVDKHRMSRSAREAKKIGRARDKALDFKMNKSDDSDEDKQFRKIYTEKFTPIGSFDKIKTLADARIEDAMRRGEFKHIPRGKKLDTTVKPHVDRTEHHLNNILVKQNLSPPWVEKQGTVNVEINSCRKEIQDKWISHVTHFYDKDHTQMKKDFEARWFNIFEAKIRLVNNSIRSYNLQAPMSTQKFYLLPDKELIKCYESNDVDAIRERVKKEAEALKLSKERDAEEKRRNSTIGKLQFWKRW
ncbi:DnaJ subfamily C member 28 [Cyberlindnera fabianii]|uniref:DnaJ subfamily C member 28 n=1 Tax=Cyberlindnera fabianii TaxID=36022 RepID=A0A1V2L6X3_CYBFA|nr:DnaJ subfamily C member 28 [Cyberlindnera fabianii]